MSNCHMLYTRSVNAAYDVNEVQCIFFLNIVIFSSIVAAKIFKEYIS